MSPAANRGDLLEVEHPRVLTIAPDDQTLRPLLDQLQSTWPDLSWSHRTPENLDDFTDSAAEWDLVLASEAPDTLLRLLTDVGAPSLGTPIVVVHDVTDSQALDLLDAGARECVPPTRRAEPTIRRLLYSERQHSELERTREALLVTESRYRALVEHTGDCVILATRTGVITYANPSAAHRLLGSGRAIGLSLTECLPSPLAEQLEEMARVVARTGLPRGGSLRLTAARQPQQLSLSAVPYDGNGEAAVMLVVREPRSEAPNTPQSSANDEKSHLRARQSGLELMHAIVQDQVNNGQGLTGVVQTALDHLFDNFPDLRITYAAVDDLGRATVLASQQPQNMASAVGRQVLLTPEQITRLLRAPRVVVDSTREGGPDDVRSFVQAPLLRTGVLSGLLGFEAPMTREWAIHEVQTLSEVGALLTMALRTVEAEREAAEAERRAIGAQRLESVGQLAGGIAHDFNNILGVIVGYADILAFHIDPEDELAEDVRQVQMAAERGAALVSQLLAFGRRQSRRPQVLDLSRTIDAIAPMLRRVLPENVVFEVRLADDLWRVTADLSQVEQILMNLTVNARDAMLRGGQLTIDTANVELDEAYTTFRTPVPPGRYVRLTIADTGSGIPPEVRDRIFEPFFTTKEAGKGTGLGLATVYGIVKQSGGFIWVYSEPDQGTTFKLYFPVTRDGEQTEAPQRRAPTPIQKRGGGELVLVVEDQDALRNLAVRMLRKAGYTVVSACNGAEALEMARELPVAPKVLLTDVIMPGLGGPELAEQLTAATPELQVIFMSGYAGDALRERGTLDHSAPVLAKPFSSTDLMEAVRTALDKRA